MATGAAVGLVAAVLGALRSGAPETLELALYDARAAVSAARHPASDGVVIVAIEEETVRLGGGVYPLPRSALAAIIDEARRAGASAVAVDYILQDPLEGSLADENLELERALAAGKVAIAAALPPAAEVGRGDEAQVPSATGGAGEAELAQIPARHARALGGAGRGEEFLLSPPLPRFALAAAALGGVSQRVARNGRLYALRHVYPTPDGDYPSLALAAAWLASGTPPIALESDRLRLGDRAIPVERDGRAYVRWYGFHERRPGAASVYPELSGAVLLQARLARDGEGDPPAPALLERLRGRVAIVCEAVAGTKDKQPTPVNPAALGGEVLANAVENILRGEGMRRLPWWGDAGTALGLSIVSAILVAAAVTRATRPWTVVVASSATTAVLLAGWWYASIAALDHGVWLPALAPMAGAVAAAFAADLRLFGFERQDRRFVHDALGRYTSQALVRTLLDRPELLEKFGGTRQELTVYFSDIRGFTTFSEGMDPEKLVDLLNEYFSALTEIIDRHGGYVDKYIGDAIMAIWGAPVPTADHAARACAAALEIRDRVAASRAGWKERYGVEIRSAGGLNTGPMVAGNIGSRQKTNYTVLGETVNVASRLEGANKSYGTSILIGEGTYLAARGSIAARAIDVVRVKGKEHGVAVYEPVAPVADLSAADRQRLAAWERSIAAYREARFADAAAGFDAYLLLAPDDAAARVLAARCREMVLHPPPPGWDGVHALQVK